LRNAAEAAFTEEKVLAAKRSGVPMHYVRTMDELVPIALVF